jgi:hypothetical protein
MSPATKKEKKGRCHNKSPNAFYQVLKNNLPNKTLAFYLTRF